MPAIVQIDPRTPYRLRVTWDVPAVGQEDPSGYSLSRADGAGPGPGIAAAWAVDAGAVELALSSPLRPGLVFALSHTTGTSVLLSLSSSRAPIGAPSDVVDPEAELFGVDVDWLVPTLAPGGDLPRVRGIAALRADLAAIAVTAPGELFHRPTAGAALPARVHGAGVAAELGRISAAVRREWVADDRVRSVSTSAASRSDGAVTVMGEVRTVPLPDEPLSITTGR